MPVEVLVVAPNRDSPFVEADVEALRQSYSVDRIAYADFRNKVDFVGHVTRRAARGDVRAILLWFLAPAYSLEVMAAARSFHVPVAVMTGGLDVDYVPELNLGGLRWPHNRLRQRIGVRSADLVLAMSGWAEGRIRRLASPRRLEVVPMAIDAERWTPAGEKERLALTVCFSITAETAQLKGVRTTIDAAALLPEVPFVVVGRDGGDGELDRLRQAATPNVMFVDTFIPEDELLALYRRAAAYVQVSAHEGFGLAAAEAMACEAIVVTTPGHALTEVVGDAGIVVPYGDARATAAAVEEALAATPEARARARARIAGQFSFAERAQRLTEALRPLVARPEDALVRIDLGCGDNKRPGTIGVDARATPAADVVSDVRHTPFEDDSVDEVYAACLLEHFENPYEVLDEIHRILRPNGRAVLRLPNLGTYSAHLDTDHKFLADLRLWRQVIGGYFDEVKVRPLGSKYRDNPLLTGLTYAAIRGLRFYELAQGWDFDCRGPRTSPQRSYTGWWMEGGS